MVQWCLESNFSVGRSYPRSLGLRVLRWFTTPHPTTEDSCVPYHGPQNYCGQIASLHFAVVGLLGGLNHALVESNACGEAEKPQ